MKPSTALERQLAAFTRLRDAAASLSQHQLDACCYVLAGTVPGMDGHWTCAHVVADLQGRVDVLEEMVARQRAERAAMWGGQCAPIVERN